MNTHHRWRERFSLLCLKTKSGKTAHTEELQLEEKFIFYGNCLRFPNDDCEFDYHKDRSFFTTFYHSWYRILLFVTLKISAACHSNVKISTEKKNLNLIFARKISKKKVEFVEWEGSDMTIIVARKVKRFFI